ncbi:MAG: bifunctional 4-hydroxy-2-oxoglutarate aldolase/2-dehydro-3-deoxy-phosphogluconate aldolase [Actinomycetes bacterium]
MPRGGVSEEFLARLVAARVIPVLRSTGEALALAAVDRCISAGLDVVELTTTTPGWRTVLSEARDRYPSHLLGVGTVLRAEDAQDALGLGADFLVSPCPAAPVREVARGRRPFIEGGMTVAEVLAAADRGIAKLFPAHVGGPSFLRSVLAIAPSALIIPTGGIALRDVPGWLAAGALAVGVGSDLLAQSDPAGALRALLVDPPSRTARGEVP